MVVPAGVSAMRLAPLPVSASGSSREREVPGARLARRPRFSYHGACRPEDSPMSRLEILHYPDPRLRRRADQVSIVDDDIRRLIDDMLDTMYDAPGIGLSAPQVNVAKRVVTIDISKDRSAPLCLVNPEVRSISGETETEEGCLSVPGVYEIVRRPEKIRVCALDRDGRSREIEAEGLLSVCIQHEIDHLEGRLFVDYLSRLKRQRIRKKAEKALRHA